MDRREQRGRASEPTATQNARLTRRGLLLGGLAGAAAVVVGGGELVEHGVLPGRHALDVLTGACSAPAPRLSFRTEGPTRRGRFLSAYRRREVDFTIAYPPDHGPGDRLPLVISLYGDGGSAASGIAGLPLGRVLAAGQDGQFLPPMALATVDGGRGLYWNPHPGDDPMAMLVREFIPMCQRFGLGTGVARIGVIGVSMGGFGALLLAETHPELISAVTAISPAVWTSYGQAHGVNPGAFASAADFARDDVVSHAANLQGIPVRIVSGNDDPFHPGVVALARKLPATATVTFSGGCHDQTFFSAQQHPSMTFLAQHLTRA